MHHVAEGVPVGGIFDDDVVELLIFVGAVVVGEGHIVNIFRTNPRGAVIGLDGIWREEAVLQLCLALILHPSHEAAVAAGILALEAAVERAVGDGELLALPGIAHEAAHVGLALNTADELDRRAAVLDGHRGIVVDGAYEAAHVLDIGGDGACGAQVADGGIAH